MIKINKIKKKINYKDCMMIKVNMLKLKIIL